MAGKSAPELLLETQAAIEEAEATREAAEETLAHAKELARIMEERIERALEEAAMLEH